MEVSAHHPNFIILLIEVVEKDVAKGDDAFQFASGANGQVSETVPLHKRHAGLKRVIGSNCEGVFGHDLTDRSAGRIFAIDDDAAHEVAFGEDAGELTVEQNGYGSDVVFDHQVGDFEYGLIGFGRYGNLILEQIADQHLHLP